MKLSTTLSALCLVACNGVYNNPGAPDAAGPDAVVADAEPGPVIVHGEKHVFVTSKAYQGGLFGGLAGADAKCAAHATAGKLTGTFKAWLSDRTVDARHRLTTHSTGAYRMVDGTVIAPSWDSLVSGTLAHSIDHDEYGKPYTAEHICGVVLDGLVAVWTATTYDGQLAVDSLSGAPDATDACGDWTTLRATSEIGDTRYGNTYWSQNNCLASCDQSAALYCLEQ